MSQLPISTATIPQELKERAQWVLWKHERRDGELTKIPYSVRGMKAKANDPTTWAPYATCIRALDNGGHFDGIGFEFSKELGITGIDFDDCLDPATGEIIDPHIAQWVSRLNSYTEISHSGNGLHILVKGNLPGSRNRTRNIEVYDSGRYFVMTGQRREGTPATIEPRQDELGAFYREFFGDDSALRGDDQCFAATHVPPNQDDAAVIMNANSGPHGEKFARLYDGDISEYDGDDSRADIALCAKLAYHTAGNNQQIDRIFRTSKLYRPKWEREDYRTITIDKACAFVASETLQEGCADDAQDAAINDEYRIQDGCLTLVRKESKTRNSEAITEYYPVKLCNFVAWIAEERIYDDGAERTRKYSITGALASGTALPLIDVPSDKFPVMAWVSQWGGRAIINAGYALKDHTRAAIQYYSQLHEYSERVVYTHIGWRQIGDQYYYLSASGALGADGLRTDIDVTLADSRLRYYDLPEPPEANALKEAVREVLDLLPDEEQVKKTLTYPEIAKVFRAPLNELVPIEATDFLTGVTGSRKTALSSVFQSFYGAGFNASTLPANWSSTANSLERLAFLVKDAVFTIDDFAPKGTARDVQTLHNNAERVIRGQANNAGRQRLRADMSLAPEYHSRGFVATTGEDVPTGQSVRGRILIREARLGDIDLEWLSKAQQRAQSGVYAQAMAGYIRWLAPQMERLKCDSSIRHAQRKKRDQFAEELKQARVVVHERTATTMAEYHVGFAAFVKFAIEVGAIDENRASGLKQTCASVLMDLARAQTSFIRAEEPTQQFIDLIRGALSGGYAHVCSTKDNDVPPDLDQTVCGWRFDHNKWIPNGKCIGWVERLELYLEPTVAFAIAQELANKQGTSLLLTKSTLYTRLVDKGIALHAQKGHTSYQKKIAGKNKRVVCIKATDIIGTDTEESECQ
jgi:hypothetical protein